MAWCARAAALLAAVAVVAGCGGGGERPAATTSTAPAAAAGAASDEPTSPVILRRPAATTVLHSRARGRAAAPVAVSVAGSAAPGETLLVTASCAQRDCRRFVLANLQGDFAATLHLALRGSPTRLTLRVDYSGRHASATAAQVRVPLRIRRVAVPKRRATPPPVSVPEQTTVPPAASSTPPSGTDPAPSGSTDRRRLVVIGDSLAVGMRPYLAADLSGWSVSIDGRVGRPLAEGMGIVASTAIADPGRTVLAISLFTNDDPTQTSRLRSAIAASLEKVGAQGCVIWATIARPPVGHVSYQAANAIIAQAAADDDRLRVVAWAAYAAATPGILAADGVHPSPAGYRQRAAMYAQAARSCG